MSETYTFKVAPNYTMATYTSGMTSVILEEWNGTSLEKFTAGMNGRGFRHSVEQYELPGGRQFAEHSWTRSR